MIRIAIVEDDKEMKDQIQEYIKRYTDDSKKKIMTESFTDGDEIVANYNASYDIILMDVQMKFMDGITAARNIRKRDPDVVIIFITNMSQYAIHGYEVNALDYILKPVNYFSFAEKLGRAIERMQKKQKDYMVVSVERGVVKLDISQIRYVESLGHKITFHLAEEEYFTHGMTMKELEEKLVPFDFYRCNKSYLVNLEYVQGIRNNYAIIAGEEILISRLKKNAFLEALTNYVGEKVN